MLSKLTFIQNRSVLCETKVLWIDAAKKERKQFLETVQLNE